MTEFVIFTAIMNYNIEKNYLFFKVHPITTPTSQ